MSLRQRAGALIYDWPRWRRTVGRGRWPLMHNRDETITTDGRGVKCEWRFTSELHIAKTFPRFGATLLRKAVGDWPIVSSDTPAPGSDISFVIGHRGLDRLPLLLSTLRTIAAQTDVAIECIVVEQSSTSEIAHRIPQWVRYVFNESHADYNRAAAFNAGVQQARGKIIILHDNDMLVPAHYAAEVVARAGEGHQFIDLKRFIFYLDRREKVSTVLQNAHGGSIAAVRETYLAIGGFDEEFVGWGGEDNDFWERAATTGATYQFGYLPMIHLYHAPQKDKFEAGSPPGVRRYREIEAIPAEERIRRLLDRSQKKT